MAGSQWAVATSATQETVLVTTAARHLVAAALTAIVMACQSTAPADGDLASLTTCRQAFQRWVEGADSLNSPEAELVKIAVAQELVQRRVFELCSLAEATSLNEEILPWRPGDIRERMIEPDMQTFAEIECVDESPLLDDTRLCAEVSR
jgi:hypothetical protein